jgi:hypothetical protein
MIRRLGLCLFILGTLAVAHPRPAPAARNRWPSKVASAR